MRVINRAIVLLAFAVTATGLLKAQVTARETIVPGAELRPESPERGSGISYRNSAPRLKKSSDPSGKYFRISLPGHHFTSETGKPELPVYSRLIEVPRGMDVSVHISDVVTKRVIFSDHGFRGSQIYPAQPARTKNQPPDEKVVVKDRKTYETGGIISHDTAVVRLEGIFRGRELYNIALYPAFYDPAGEYVDLITSMNVRIITSPSENKGEGTYPPAGEKGGYASEAYITGYTDEPVTMIIVTDSVFSKHLQPLIKWKTLKGIKTTVLYKGEGSADTVYNDLKSRITSLYTSAVTAGNPPQYLLIIGDLSIIPASRGTGNVSDLYYGEFDGEGDYIPELFIGRLPVSDTTQLKGMVSKIIDYESYTFEPGNKFWSGAVATAGNDLTYQKYMNGQIGYLFDEYLSLDTSLNAIHWLYPDASQKDDSLKLLFNEGLSLLNYTGHGEANGFSDPAFKTTDVSGLTNTDMYPLIIANACRTAQINVASCFGSAMVNAPDKGAIGFIGCTNDSFWADDFYWSVGPGTADTTATYDNTGTGAFDRLFHTHDEAPGEWYYTMGHINFAGNMAVSASTSSRKKYYWETYMLLGDPSLAPMVGRPDLSEITVPDILPQELTSLNFFARPFSYAAITDFDTLCDARFVSPSGNVSLEIPEGIKDSCLLIVTGQNLIPFRRTLHFGSVAGPFLVTESIVLDDSQGNNNGSPDYGERINLRVTIKNLGQTVSSGLNADISATAGMITVEQAMISIGDISPGESYTIDNAFIFSISDEAEDGELASLLLTLADNGNEYLFGIDMTILAPDISIVSSVHDDTYAGNANYLPDAGETVRFNIRVRNEGSSATSGMLSVIAPAPWLTLATEEIATGILDPGTEKVLSLEAEISDLALPGTEITYGVNLVCGKYEASDSYSIRTGKTRETWEFDRFDVFPWIQEKDIPWTITTSTAFENVRSARSGNIPDKDETVLAIYVNNPVRDTVSFYSKVSSEFNYDELIFRIDSITDLQISGETPWTLRQAILKPGVHYLEWIYRKDVSLAGGLDAAWIDDITFPDISFLDADMRIDTVYAPPATADLNNVVVRGSVVNLGRNTLTSFPLAYRINDGEAVNETFFLKIDPGDTVDVTFGQTCKLLPETSYRIYIISRLPEDGYSGNDTAYTTFIKTGIEIPQITEGVARIMPNPFTDGFVLEIDAAGEESAEIELLDTQGRSVLFMSEGLMPGINRINIRCQSLAAGIYTLRITIGEKVGLIRAVKGGN
ncbi:MAG: C25 family cysteine peptidase [Bacteroidales bacterium]|nr:C25 family cysteine peptidase [Bacteroidales bacterium]